MAHNYVLKSTRSSWSEENLLNVLEQITKKTMSVKQASKNYSIPRTTLIHHLKRKVGSPGNANLGRFRTAFLKDTEEELLTS